jgi:predicted nucleotidyltransferase
MPDARIRQQIALLAARLMYERTESEYFTAKRKAARQLGLEYRFHPHDLPSNAEIRDHIQALANMYEGDTRTQNLRAMRLAALRMMRLLSQFRPRLIGSTLTGHTRKGSDIDLHLFSNNLSSVTAALDEQGYAYDVERKRVVKHNEERIFTHIHVEERFRYELTLYAADQAHYVFKSSITGRAIERASIAELEQFLKQEYAGIDLDEVSDAVEQRMDRFEIYRMLLKPLEKVEQRAAWHPEGDALYHTLQVFELARDRVPYDEEFLLAALLHDVGKAIDPYDHVSAGLEALEGAITPRTRFLIEHHMDAHAIADGTIGHRAKLRLAESADYEDLLLLGELDRAGRRTGVQVCTIDDAIDYIRALEDEPYLA